MCGRGALLHSREEIRAICGASRWEEASPASSTRQVETPRYNLSPQSSAPVLIEQSPHELVLYSMRWGLSSSLEHALALAPINARAETLESKAMFRKLIQKNRCICLFDGFFEWKFDEKSQSKIGYFVQTEEEEMLFLAGLYDTHYEGDKDSEFYSFTIITTRYIGFRGVVEI